MKQSDPLQLVKEGTLERPGLVGRVVRLGMGIACVYAAYVLLVYHQAIIDRPVSVLPNIAVIVFGAIFIINYVVNIGFGKSWGRWPSYFTLAATAALSGLGWILFGTPDHPVLGLPLWLWLLYFYAHLGFSFLLAAIIATPGCEMRSIPELVGRIGGRAAEEHHCPASFITKIDDWEKKAKPV